MKACLCGEVCDVLLVVDTFAKENSRAASRAALILDSGLPCPVPLKTLSVVASWRSHAGA